MSRYLSRSLSFSTTSNRISRSSSQKAANAILLKRQDSQYYYYHGHPRQPRQPVAYHRHPFSALASSPHDENEHENEDKNDDDDMEGDDVILNDLMTSQDWKGLQALVTQWNHGVPVNVKSPKQVSLAIFGRHQTTTRSVLEQAANTNNNNIEDKLTPNKRRLAKAILALRQQPQQQTTTTKPPPPKQSISTTTTASITDPISTVTTATTPSTEAVHNQKTKNTRRKKIKTHEQWVEEFLFNDKSLLDPYWKQPLLDVSRPTARALISQLDPNHCPMGYNPNASPKVSAKMNKKNVNKPGTFLHYCRQQKQALGTCIVLVRCGDFYETFGIDAILLVEHVGLNPMAGKARAGCPYRNIQATLDACTQQGFSVAVHEEINSSDGTSQSNTSSSSGGNLKARVLTQVVSPAAPTYLYDNWLLGSDNHHHDNNNNNHYHSLDGLPPSRPCVGIVHTSTGYHYIQVSMEERSILYSHRMTPEAVACRLAAYPPADPLLYIPSPQEASTKQQQQQQSYYRLPFLPKQQRPSPSPQQPQSTSTTTTTIPMAEKNQHPNEWMESFLGGSRIRTKIISPHFIPSPQPGVSDADRHIHIIMEHLLNLHSNQQQQQQPDQSSSSSSFYDRVSMDDFTISMADGSTTTSTTTSTTITTAPLYVETATQLGLLQDPNIPSLIHYVLDDAAPAATRRYVHRNLLIPPPAHVANAMATLVDSFMTTVDVALPPLTVPPLGKVLSLIRAGQASASIYGTLLQSLATTRFVLLGSNTHNNNNNDDKDSSSGLPIDALLTLCQHESGLAAEQFSLLERCEKAMATIEAVVSTNYHVNHDDDVESYYYHDDDDNDANHKNLDTITQDMYLPDAFFERNESPWRGRVQPQVAHVAYERVQTAAARLCQAVSKDFGMADQTNNSNNIVQDIFNNLIALKKLPDGNIRDDVDHDFFFHPRDRHGKLLRNRYTTHDVQEALSEYVVACEFACDEVSSILTGLANTLQDDGHIPVIVQSAHFNLALSAAFHHAVKATQRKWHLAETIEPTPNNNSHASDEDGDQLGSTTHSSGSSPPAHFVRLWPYWMEKSQAVSNTFDLEGLFLLTAPNMSGKSTLMRSTAAAALLTICGLCAPLQKGSKIPRFDTLFLRGASADVPSEDKSAFGAEMGDVAAMLRCCGPRSLVFVDELGRGTSPRDGTRLAGAVLEAMAKKEMTGIFATHLHDILDLPLERQDRMTTKRMGIDQTTTIANNSNEDNHDFVVGDQESYEWTYRLEDGVCTDSLALVTAARFGLPEEIIRRAEELDGHLPFRSSTTNRVKGSSDEDLDQTEKMAIDPQLVSNGQSQKKSKKTALDFQRAMALAEEVTGRSPISIPPRWSPPASLGNSQSCVYILEIQPQRYYVGETDALSQRLRQHRKKWANCKAMAVSVPSKTEARSWESLLIRKMAQSGFSMQSVRDGTRERAFRSSSTSSSDK